MASAAQTVYETTLGQELYETSLNQMLYETTVAQAVVERPDGLHWVSWQMAGCEAFRTDWRDLASRASEPNPFMEEWFLLPSLKQFDPSARVRLAAFYRDGKVRGIFPLEYRHSYYGYLIPHVSTWLHANAFHGSPLVEDGYEQEFWSELLCALDNDPRGALFLHLPSLLEQCPTEIALGEVANCEQRLSGTVMRTERAMLRSELAVEEYLNASLSNKRRKELRRQKRRLGELGELLFERKSGTTVKSDWISEFLELEASGWKGREGSALESQLDTRAMFRETMLGAANAGKIELLTLRLDGKPIAMLVNFITPPGAFSFKTAYDEEYYRFSPGVLLQLENLALLERDDIEWCDSCASEGHPMIDRIWRERRSVIAHNIAIGGGFRRKIFERILRTEMKPENAR